MKKKRSPKLIVVNTKDEIPEWWNSHEALQDELKPIYTEYAKLTEVKNVETQINEEA